MYCVKRVVVWPRFTQQTDEDMDPDDLRPVRFAYFALQGKAKEPLHLPDYKGSTVRGAFGNTFRRIVCALRRNDCSECMIRSSCVFSYVFETPPPQDSKMMWRYPYAPHPFVINPPLEQKRVYAPGEALEFSLILIGKAMEYLPYFVYTFDEMGQRGIGKERGEYLLKTVCNIEPEGGSTRIYWGDEKRLSNTYRVIDIQSLGDDTTVNALTLSFLTPTRIKFQGTLTMDLDFGILVRNLLRRISMLSYFHCGYTLELDYRNVIEEAQSIKTVRRSLTWWDWERYSSRQRDRMKLGGFVGCVQFEGEITQFMPLILLGEYLHVGKGTSFGLGRYEIIEKG